MSDRFLHSDASRFRWTALAFACASTAALVLYLVEEGPAALRPLSGAATLVFVSKLSIFSGLSPRSQFTPWELGLLAWVLDLWIACGLVAGIASFERLPLAGRALGEAHVRAGVTLREYPGLRRLAFWGVAVLVLLPLPGAGAVAGTLAARLIGLSRVATLAAVATGSGVASSSYAGMAVFLGEQWRAILTDPLTVIASVVGLALFLWVAWLRVKRELMRG